MLLSRCSRPSRCGAVVDSRAASGVYRSSRRVALRCAAQLPSSETSTSTEDATKPQSTAVVPDVEKEVKKFTNQAAATFAPRPSGAVKNPAFRGSVLYDIFEWQAWISMVVGGLLSFNVLYPTDDPSIPRLLGMWSIWMFTIPSLRARECLPKEKEALNLLFLLVPLLNVALPFVWKSFPFIFTADVIAVFGVYLYKGVWREVYNLPLELPGGGQAAAPVPEDQQK